MSIPLRALLVEDSEADAELLLMALRQEGYAPEFTRVETAAAMRAALTTREWDLVLCDKAMPEFDALSALRLLRATHADLPFIIVSGAMGEEQAVEAMKLGATDYLFKNRLARLGQAVRHALQQSRHRQEQLQTELARRRQAEDERLLLQKLAEETARLIAAQAVAKIGSWETDLASGEVAWSQETHRIFETTPETFAPTHVGFMQLVYPDDRAMVEGAFLASLIRSDPCCLEHRLRLPDGRIKILEERWQVFFDALGRAVRAVGTCQDITERKLGDAALRESEERFRAIFGQAGIGIALVGPVDGRILRSNRALAEMLGYSEEEMLFLTVQQVSEPEDYRDDRAQWEQMFSGKIARFQMEKRYRRKDGVLTWGLLTSTLVRDSGGQPLFVIGMVEGIDERKTAETELHAAETQLHALIDRLNTVREDEAKRIARELHDDLGQRLTALHMELSGLEMNRPEAPPAQRQQIARMLTAVDSTIEAVQKLASGLRLGQLDVFGLTAAIDWHAKEFSRLSNIPCHWIRLDEVTGLTDAQNTNLFRILQEALTNISRHAGATEVALSLTATSECVVLMVRDNGRGIAPSELADRKAIGLLGMRERAQLVGGTLTISGAPGDGTVVHVSIPRRPIHRITP